MKKAEKGRDRLRYQVIKEMDRTVFCIFYYRETNSVLRGNF